MPVNFIDHRMNDRGISFPVEDVFRLFGSWAGLHDYSFDSTFSAEEVQLIGVAAGWTESIESVSLPTSYTISYHKVDTRQGIVINHGSVVKFLVATLSSGYPAIYRNTGSGYVLAHTTPTITPETADVIVTFRQIQMTDSDDSFWWTISVWMNDKLITTYSEHSTTIVSGCTFGFAVYNGDTVSYTNVNVPELTETAEFGTLDPGEYPMGGMQRSIEGRYIRFFIRFNGSFRVWKSKSIPVSLTYESETKIDQSERGYDISAIASHIRIMGAWRIAEAYSSALTATYGHRFREDNNPMLMTESECFEEAKRTLLRIEEAVFSESIGVSHIPLIEVEDRIETPTGDYLISGLGLSFGMGFIDQSVNARKYVWG